MVIPLRCFQGARPGLSSRGADRLDDRQYLVRAGDRSWCGVVMDDSSGTVHWRTRMTIGRTGRWRVHTEASVHELDLDARVWIRHPRTNATPVTGTGPLAINVFESDGTPVPLTEVLVCRLGHPMLLLVDLAGDGVPSRTRSTIVTCIERIADRSGAF